MGWTELLVGREGELRDWWGCECSYGDFTGEIVYDIGNFSLIGCTA
jgi:hypothetical protein